MTRFNPDRGDHDAALATCARLTDAQTKEFDSEVLTVDMVASAYACNMPAYVSRGVFTKALSVLREAGSGVKK